MQQAGLVEVSWSIVFQLINTIFLIGIIYVIYYLIFKLPKKVKERDKKIDELERKIDTISEKLDKYIK